VRIVEKGVISRQAPLGKGEGISGKKPDNVRGESMVQVGELGDERVRREVHDQYELNRVRKNFGWGGFQKSKNEVKREERRVEIMSSSPMCNKNQ